MGLVDEYVEVKLCNNIKYWENLGYEIPRIKNKQGTMSVPMGSKIKVKIKDLPKKSHIEVYCSCDGCGKIFKREYRDYIKNKYVYCKNCSHTIDILKNKNKKELIISFEQWCIENNKQDILDRWDYELNKCSPCDIIFKTGKKYYFKCNCNYKHKSELKQINTFTMSENKIMGCKQCNSFAQWGINNICEDFLEKYWDYDKNTLNPWKIDYATNKKIWIKCQEKSYHGSYEISCNNFTCGNCRCPYCENKNNKIHPMDSLGQYIIDNFGEDFLNKIWSNKNKKSPFKYSPFSVKKVWWKCSNDKHEDYFRSISSSNKYNFRCPKCSREKTESILQEKVRTYIESLNYTILHEEKCSIHAKNPKTNRWLPFDNEIKELKLIIEVNGIQHYKITNIHNLSANHYNTTPEYELHYQKVKDRYKRIIAKQNDYYFLEIPYWTDNENEDWKQLIDNKINEILTK